jgi:hypothetical protein
MSNGNLPQPSSSDVKLFQGHERFRGGTEGSDMVESMRVGIPDQYRISTELEHAQVS